MRLAESVAEFCDRVLRLWERQRPSQRPTATPTSDFQAPSRGVPRKEKSRRSKVGPSADNSCARFIRGPAQPKNHTSPKEIDALQSLNEQLSLGDSEGSRDIREAVARHITGGPDSVARRILSGALMTVGLGVGSVASLGILAFVGINAALPTVTSLAVMGAAGIWEATRD